MNRGRPRLDLVFRYGTLIFASSLTFLAFLFFYVLSSDSLKTLKTGLAFLYGSTWDPVNNVFQAFPMIYGSFMTTAIALLIGVPLSIGVAVFLSELSPRVLRSPLSFIVEMLAAVPSVVYGLWGVFVLAPFLYYSVYPVIHARLGFVPFLAGTPYEFSILTAGVILAIMIIPIVSSISRDAILAVPSSQREAAYALGATRSEVIRISVLSYARSGIFASIFLGFGRAFGETMAVTMVIGNTSLVTWSVFSPGNTLASLLANEYSEALPGSPVLSALVEAGLVLLLVSFLSNVVGRLLVRRLARSREAASFL